MLHNMQFQLAGVNERLGAVRALMRLCRGMCRFHVVPQIPRLGELLLANTALIRLTVARMNQRVRLQVAWVCEPFLAERALERPLSRMRVRVNLQCLGAHKRLVTNNECVNRCSFKCPSCVNDLSQSEQW